MLNPQNLFFSFKWLFSIFIFFISKYFFFWDLSPQKLAFRPYDLTWNHLWGRIDKTQFLLNSVNLTSIFWQKPNVNYIIHKRNVMIKKIYPQNFLVSLQISFVYLTILFYQYYKITQPQNKIFVILTKMFSFFVKLTKKN